MVIRLLDVHCRDTEDVTGADEFYSDKDDELGSMSDRIRVKDLRPGSTIRAWRFKGGASWYSSWEHTIRYQITAET